MSNSNSNVSIEEKKPPQTVVLENQPVTNTTPPVTKQVKSPEEIAKEQSDEYMKELRLAAAQRVKLPDGKLSEPGAGIPQADLAKIYKREKLDKKV